MKKFCIVIFNFYYVISSGLSLLIVLSYKSRIKPEPPKSVLLGRFSRPTNLKKILRQDLS